MSRSLTALFVAVAIVSGVGCDDAKVRRTERLLRRTSGSWIEQTQYDAVGVGEARSMVVQTLGSTPYEGLHASAPCLHYANRAVDYGHGEVEWFEFCFDDQGRLTTKEAEKLGLLTPPTSPSTPTESIPCGPERDDCTSAEVTATVTRIYVLHGGATGAEAACLAPITSDGKHAVNEAFDAPKPRETEEAIACVGSEARLHVITQSIADYFGALNAELVGHPSTNEHIGSPNARHPGITGSHHWMESRSSAFPLDGRHRCRADGQRRRGR